MRCDSNVATGEHSSRRPGHAGCLASTRRSGTRGPTASLSAVGIARSPDAPGRLPQCRHPRRVLRLRRVGVVRLHWTVILTLITVAVFLVYFLLIGPLVEERTAAASLRRLGYRVAMCSRDIDEPEPARFAGRAHALSVRDGPPLDDAAVNLILRFCEVRCLVLECREIVPGALARLRDLPYLHTVAIRGDRIDDESLRGIGGSRAVVTLMINNTTIRGPALSESVVDESPIADRPK